MLGFVVIGHRGNFPLTIYAGHPNSDLRLRSLQRLTLSPSAFNS